ncbi:matrin-3 isoform X2 [Hyla sarda]|uniref:matrin-3 isoform X2 n=1 Tax=Hyla sarda TaxID=327740 RepID=UPI0024C28514|nr:matrin-3 isoform X2 [Hyla sarda]
MVYRAPPKCARGDPTPGSGSGDSPGGLQGWHEHINGPTHRRHRMLLLEVYPEWRGHGMGENFMLQQSTNHAPGILGPPPPKSLLSMGGAPDGRHGPPRPHLGMEDLGPRRGPNRMGGGRVVHIINFERGRNLKNQLLRLAEPFGEITNYLILNKMNEAFIEMSNANDAMAVVDYYSTSQAIVMGKPVRVHLSQKYKRIKKLEQKPDTQSDQKKTEPGRVVHLSRLPSYGYKDAALLKLAENFGKVKTYILMRVRNQAFIEMEKAEDAQNMVKQCEIVPLVFHERTLKVDLSERYKKLVLRIPNKLIDQKEKNRKRGHSPDVKEGVKGKQKKTEGAEETTGDEDQAGDVTTDDTVHTSEETDQKDLVSDSCEPELVEEEEEEPEEVDEEEAAARLETNSSVADDEEQDVSGMEEKDAEDEDQTEAQEPEPSDPSDDVAEEKLKRESKFSGNIDDFVTLDEVGDEEDTDKVKAAVVGKPAGKRYSSSFMASTSAEEAEMENYAEPEDRETCKPAAKSESAPAQESTAETSTIPELAKDYDLPLFEPNRPIGVGFVVPKTGFYCKLCSLFYTNEEVAKVTHCSTLPHYQKLKKLRNKMSASPAKKN